jgi:hypothetical protein
MNAYWSFRNLQVLILVLLRIAASEPVFANPFCGAAKLTQVNSAIGGTMTEEEARQIVGKHTTDELRAIAAALSVRPAENTDDDWDRLEAACLLLGHLAPAEAVAVLKAHKRFQGE